MRRFGSDFSCTSGTADCCSCCELAPLARVAPRGDGAVEVAWGLATEGGDSGHLLAAL